MKEESAEFASTISRQNVAKEGWTTYYVDGTNGNDGNNGLTWESAFKTIQAAIDKAESWAKIYIKAGTYAEKLTIEKDNIKLIGEKVTTTIIRGENTNIIRINGNHCSVERITTYQFRVLALEGTAIYLWGDYNSIADCILDSDIGIISWGVYGSGNYCKCINVRTISILDDIVHATGNYWEIHDNLTGGIKVYGNYGKIWNNDVESIYVAVTGGYNTIFHNNLISAPTDNGSPNKWFENFYSVHTTDTNNDGLCDTPYTFVTGTDYTPVSKRNGWLQESLGFGSGGGGDHQGDIEIWDSFEYVSDAALQAKWIEGGDAGNPTRSGTVYEGQYSLQTIIGAGGVGHVYRLLAARNMKTLANIGIASQSSVGGDTFQFTLYDSSGNYSYWTETCNVAANTWTYHNINPHSAPTGVGPAVTGVDLEDVVEIRMASLTASSTYKFDFIKFSSLVASKIGLGYDGFDDAVEDSSSVRGHLLLTNEVLARTGTFYFVGIGGNDANDGKSWTNRRLTVASGYGLCSSGDTLIIGPGTFTENTNFNTDGVWLIGRQPGLVSGTTIIGASTMTCKANRFENIFFYNTAGTVVKVGNDADSNNNEFWYCRIGGAGSAIVVHIDASVASGAQANIFDHCNLYEGSTAVILIDGGAAIGNVFRECRIRPQTGVASHGIHVNHASTLRNTFIDCVIVGAGSTGTGIFFQAGTHNIADNCFVNDITTPYNIAANNYIVGCHEDSEITSNNTVQEDFKAIYDKISPLGGSLVTKAITFTALAAAADLFTVTGDVIVRIIAVVKTNCASAGGCNAEIGIAADTDAIIPTTDVTLLAAQEIWHDATPDSEIEALVTFREYIITDGNDIIITPSAQIDSGALLFYCFWTALSSGATVVAA